MNHTDPHSEHSAVPLIISRLLCAVVLIQSAVQVWLIWVQEPSSVNSFLFRQDVGEATLNAVDQVLIWTLLIGCTGVFVKKLRWTLLAVFTVFLLLAVFKTLNADGGPLYDRFAPAAQAIRIFVPLAVFLISRPEVIARKIAFQGIRWCSAFTFITHGAECFYAHPAFIDLIIGSGYRMLDIMISETQARTAMYVIGCMDIATAALLVGRRWRYVALWMAIWAGLAACSRMTSGGVDMNWHKTLLRVANAGGPLVLFLWWSLLRSGENNGTK